MSTQPVPSERITRCAAAAIIGVSTETTRYYEMRGELTASKNAAGHSEFDPKVVHAFAARRKAKLRARRRKATRQLATHLTNGGRYRRRAVRIPRSNQATA